MSHANRWLSRYVAITLTAAMACRCAAAEPEKAALQLQEMPAGYTLQFYDDCGVVGRQPHIPANTCHTFPESAVKADLKARSNTYGVPNFEAVYTGLKGDVPYVLAVTYSCERNNKRVQSLSAGAVPLHGPRTLPDGAAERLIFRVPPAAIQNGTLTLHFTRNSGPNAVGSVLELWAPLPAQQASSFSAIPLVSGKVLGSISDVAYEGVAGIKAIARDAASGAVLGEATSQTNGQFTIDLAKHVKPGATGSIEVVAQCKDGEKKCTVPMADLMFTPPQFRPIPENKAAVMVLDGVWRLHPSPSSNFQNDATTGPGWTNFTVPGQWLQQGCNTPQDKPVAVATDFQISAAWAGQRIFLRFDAVHGGAHYWLNGQRLGYSENLFTPVEFDVTGAIKPGVANHLALEMKVDTPSEVAAYASKYAHHNLGGIPRSVRVFALPAVHLSSLHHETILDGDYRDAALVLNAKAVNATAKPVSDVVLRVGLEGPDGKRVPLAQDAFDLGTLAPGATEFSQRLAVANPLKWSAEKPHLYKLTVELANAGAVLEQFVQTVGFRKVEVRGTELWVNGKAVKLAGMCRHEFDPLTGRAATVKHAEGDARLFKDANINFVRTSHYPPTREFLDACDRIGLYVESEAPFCWTRSGRGEDDPAVTKHFLNPAAAMVDYNRDHPSVILWSLGNESGTTPSGENRLRLNFAEMLDLTRKLDRSRVTIFDNEWNKDGGACDLACLHYPPFPPEECGFVKDDLRPILIDEGFPFQGHDCGTELTLNPAMDSRDWSRLQNGPDSYWSHIYHSPRLCGLTVWAGIDEEFYLPDGTTQGDGQWAFLDNWRRPKALWWDAKRVFAPVWIPIRKADYSPGQPSVRVPVENRYTFTDLSEIKATWELGAKTGRCKIALPPGQKGEMEVPIPSGIAPGALLVLKFTTADGRLITAHGIRLGARPAVVLAKPNTGCPDWQDDGKTIAVRGNGFGFSIDRASGKITSSAANPVALRSFPVLHCTRRDFNHWWRGGGLPYAEFPDAGSRKIGSVTVEQRGPALAIRFTDSYTDFKGHVEMLLDKSGVASVAFDYVYSGKTLDRSELGLRFVCNKDCQEIRWQRETEWDVYPDDHIGRSEGRAVAVAPAGQGRGVFTPYKSKPTWPWHLDTNEFGTRDFRSAKYNVYSAQLTEPDGASLMVQSDGSADVRACLAPDAVLFHVLLSGPPVRLHAGGYVPPKQSPGDRLSGAFLMIIQTSAGK